MTSKIQIRKSKDYNMSQNIQFKNGQLIVPDQPVIPFIEGDGIGKDISGPSQRVIDAAVAAAYGDDRKLIWKEVLAGKKAFEMTGSYMPDETLEAFKEYLVGIKGPLETPVGDGIRSLNVALRQTLDLFVCLRPIRWFKGVPSPIRYPELVDMHIFRENTEDIYSGIEFMTGDEKAIRFRDFLINELGVENIRFPESSSFGVKPVSKEGSERLIRAAIQYTVSRGLPSVTIVHKGNIMKFTEGAFKNWGYDLAETEFADQISDQLAAMVGGIGISPGANINYNSGYAIFEATHGTAPNIAGTGKANPGSLILSGAMLLEYLGWDKAAEHVYDAMEHTFSKRRVTSDLFSMMEGATLLSTSEFADEIIRNTVSYTHLRAHETRHD